MKQHALTRPGVQHLLLISLLVAGAASVLPIPWAAAELDQEINLVTDGDGLQHVSQVNSLWQNDLIGYHQDIRMAQCGCLLSTLSAVLDYQPPGFPWFPVRFQLPGATLTLNDFNPRYLDAYFHLGPDLDKDPGWGYKLTPPGTCGTAPLPYATIGVANIGGIPVGVNWVRREGLRRDLVDVNLLLRRPTIVIKRNEANTANHAQLIVGWDNTQKKYLILDPLWQHNDLVGPGVPNQVVPRIPTAGSGTYEEWESKITTTLDFLLAGLAESHFWLFFGDDPAPIEIQMVNPAGQKTGFDPVTQRVFEQDPSASYWVIGAWADPLGQIPPGDPAKYVTVHNPVEGTYRFQVIGTGDGSFSVSAAIMAGGSQDVLHHVTDTITQDEVRKFEFRFSPTGSSTVSEVANFTPEAKVGNDVQGLTDFPIPFDARRSFDVDGTIVSYTWDFGDGTTDTGEQVVHEYTVPGIYTVRLTVVDDGGATATATLQASIILSQRRPAADSSGPYLGFAGAVNFPAFIDFNGSKSFDPNGDPLTFKWNFGDGSPAVVDTFPFVRHTYTAPGKYTVTLIVNDGIEDSEPAVTTVEVLPPPGSPRLHVSVLPSCGPAGTPITFQVEPLALVSPTSAVHTRFWDFGAEGPLPPIPTRITLGIPSTPDGHVRLRAQGPIDTLEEFVPWTAALSSPLVFSLRIFWTIPTSWELGVYQLTLGEEFTTSFQVPCPEPDNHPPLAHAGGPTYVGHAGLPITFDGSLSSDPDGDPLTYIWHFGDGNMGSGVNPQHTYAAAGRYVVTLIVSDGQDFSFPTVDTNSFAEATVGAGSNQPVVCSAARPSRDVLWPPNHKLIPLSIVGVTDPDNDPVTIHITGVRQDEPVNGSGDGNTSPDATGVGTGTVRVRSERSGQGDGRVYHISFRADDGKGGICTYKVTVCVPHDQGQHNTCIDQGQLFDSTVSQ
jgi:PKD repeat protein